MDKLPLVNYSGIIKEINAGDKVPINYLQGADSIVEIPDSAFADADNPTVSETQVWIAANLTAEELIDSTVVYVRDIVLKPEEYTFPTSSRSLTISGSDQANLDSITINGNVYTINLPLQDSAGLALNDADLYTLQAAIIAAFATEGFTVEALILYAINLATITIKIWQTVYNSGNPSFTWSCTHTNNSSSSTSGTVTNTASIASGEITYTSSQEDPFAVYKVINSHAYLVNQKERVSFYDISVRNLPTHDPLQHPYGLIATVDKTGLKYESTKEGWVLLSNTRYGTSVIEPIVEISNSIIYINDAVYVKILVKSNAPVNPSNYLQLYVRFTKIEPNFYIELVDGLTTPFVEINGKLEATNTSWVESTDETLNTTFRNCTGGGSYSTPLYLKLVNTDASGSSGMNLTVNAFIHNGIYKLLGSSVSTSSFNLVLDTSNTIRLEEQVGTNKNTILPSYTDTDLGTITLGTEDTGKQIWNITQSEVQVWDGTAWVALGSGGGGGANLTFSGASSPYTLASDSGTDVTFSAGSNITLTRTGNDLEIAATGGGATNLTFSGSGPFTLESDTGTDVTFTEGDNINITRTGNDLTVAVIDVVKTTTNQTISGVKTFGAGDFTQVTGGSVYIENSGSHATDISANYVGLFNSGTGESSFTATSSKIVNRSGYTVGASDLLRKDEIEALISASGGGSPEYDAAVSGSNSGTITLNRSEELFLTTSLTNAHTFTIALDTQTSGKVNEYIIIFKIGATVPAITHPAGVIWRGSTPYLAANQTWTIVYEYVQIDSTPTWEIYGTAIKNV